MEMKRKNDRPTLQEEYYSETGGMTKSGRMRAGHDGKQTPEKEREGEGDEIGMVAAAAPPK